jgi:hypothetical protein
MSSSLWKHEFVKRWSQMQLLETAAAQSHFNDVCALVGHKTPIEKDPTGQFFTFEAPTEKPGGDRGRADVWYKGRFTVETPRRGVSTRNGTA